MNQILNNKNSTLLNGGWDSLFWFIPKILRMKNLKINQEGQINQPVEIKMLTDCWKQACWRVKTKYFAELNRLCSGWAE